MVHIRTRRAPEQRVLLDACVTSAPVVRPRGVTPPRPHRPAGIGRQVLNELLAAEAPRRYTVAGLVPRGQLAVVPLLPPMDDPAEDPAEDPQPVEELLAEDSVLSAERLAGLAAAEWVDAAVGTVMAEHCTAVLDAVADRPELRHDHALLMALAPVVAMLKAVEL